jgi:hypothetical protein
MKPFGDKKSWKKKGHKHHPKKKVALARWRQKKKSG